MHEVLGPAAQAAATVTLTILEGQVLVKSIRDFTNMAFTEFASLHAVMPLPCQQIPTMHANFPGSAHGISEHNSVKVAFFFSRVDVEVEHFCSLAYQH